VSVVRRARGARAESRSISRGSPRRSKCGPGAAATAPARKLAAEGLPTSMETCAGWRGTLQASRKVSMDDQPAPPCSSSACTPSADRRSATCPTCSATARRMTAPTDRSSILARSFSIVATSSGMTAEIFVTVPPIGCCLWDHRRRATHGGDCRGGGGDDDGGECCRSPTLVPTG